MSARHLLGALGALGALAASAGCQRKAAAIDPCLAVTAALVEVRDRDGTFELALRPLPDGSGVLCDAQGRLLGKLVRTSEPPALVLKNAAGDADATLTFARGAGDSALLAFRGTTLRIYDDGSLLRLLDGNGVPIGQLSRDGARAIAFDPGGRPLAEALRADKEGDRRIVRAPDGTLRTLIAGVRDDRAAAAFALAGLPMPERLMLARWLER